MDAFAVSVCKGLSLGKYQLVAHGNLQARGFRISGIDAAGRIFAWKYVYGSDHKCVALDRICSSFFSDRRRYDPGGDVTAACAMRRWIWSSRLWFAATASMLRSWCFVCFLSKVAIVPAVCLIGIVTFVCSATGVKIGSPFGAWYRLKAELCGGVILILIAVKTLAEGVGRWKIYLRITN